MIKHGQADLRVETMAFNDRFASTFVADVGKEFPNDPKDPSSSKDRQVISSTLTQIESYLKYLNNLAQNKGQAINDPSVIKQQIAHYTSVDAQARKAIHQDFERKFKALRTEEVEFFKTKVKCVRLHDLVKGMLDETFTAFVKLFPSIAALEIIYGSFNRSVPDLGGTPISDFPIDFLKLSNLLKEKSDARYVGYYY